MTILPVINCSDELMFKERLEQMKHMISAGDRVHLDVADGSFTAGYTTWLSPEAYQGLLANSRFSSSLHIMAKAADQAVSRWLPLTPAEITVHLETIIDPLKLASACKSKGVNLYLGITLQSNMEKVLSALKHASGCLVLAVDPGKSGQDFQPAVLTQVSQIRTAFPTLPICVDGGVRIEAVSACRRAGATELAVGAHIFNETDPVAAYKRFVDAANS